MEKPREQDQTADEPSAAAADRLTARLMRRYTEPVGVVNTHHPQQIHARTAGWVAGRFAMLDHWRARYAGDENAAAASGDFVLTSSPLTAMREKINSAPNSPPISRSAAPPSSPASTPTPAPTLRVSRRIARRANAAPLSPAPIGHSPKSSPVTRSGSEQNSGEASGEMSGKSAGGLRATEIAAPTSAGSTPMVWPKGGGGADTPVEAKIQRAQNTGVSPMLGPSPVSVSVESGAQNAGEARGGMSGKSSSDLQATEIATPSIGNSTPLVLARVGGEVAGTSAAAPAQRKQTDESLPNFSSDAVRNSGEPTAPTKTVAEVSAPTVSTAAAKATRKIDAAATGPNKGRVVEAAAMTVQPLLLRSPSLAADARLQRQADTASPRLLKGKVIGAPAAEAAPPRLPLSPTTDAQAAEISPSPLAATLIQRQTTSGETGHLRLSVPREQIHEDRVNDASARATPPMASGKSAVAGEIPASTSALTPPRMVWRQSADHSSAVLPRLARSEASAPSAPISARQSYSESSTTVETFAPESAPSSSSAAVDVEQIAEQVSRLLARQLTVERERRGR